MKKKQKRESNEAAGDGTTLGYTFNDPALLERALTHRSVSRINNERQEFLGDALLGAIIAEALYAKFPQASEGNMTRLRAMLVNGDTLANVAKRIELGRYLRLGPGERKSGAWHRNSLLADTLEALFAAIYLDAGFAQCRHYVLQVYQPELDRLSALTDEDVQPDAKTRLQEYTQARGPSLPVYVVLQESGPPHRRVFRVQCQVKGIDEEMIAEAKSKRQAEQAAAELTLRYLQQES